MGPGAGPNLKKGFQCRMPDLTNHIILNSHVIILVVFWANIISSFSVQRAYTTRKMFYRIGSRFPHFTSFSFLMLTPEFFCITSLPLTSTRWFNQHIQAFHTLRSAVDISRQHQELIFVRKILGNAQNRTRGCWVRSANATSLLCRPPPEFFSLDLCFVIFFFPTLKKKDSEWKNIFFVSSLINI